MSRFTEIVAFNESFGNQSGDYDNPNWEHINAQYELIKGGLEELELAIKNKDMVQIRDGAGDVLVATYGLFHRIGKCADTDLIDINDSNNTKLCLDTDEAMITARKYEKAGVVVSFYYPGDGRIAVISAKDQFDLDGRFVPKGKLLKSVNTVPPRLE